MDKATTVLIGCGNRGVGGHGRRARRSKTLELVAVCDIDAERLEAASRQLDVPGERDYRKLLERDDVQSVIVATTTPYHVPIALDAVRAGKHVLVEKPLAESAAEARRLVEAAEQAGVIGMVGYQRRFSEFGAALKRVAGEIVPVQMLLTTQRLPMNRQFFSPRHYDGVVDTATHDIHLALWTMGGEPEAVYGTVARGTILGDETIEFFQALVEYGSGDFAGGGGPASAPAGTAPTGQRRTLTLQGSMLGVQLPHVCQVVGLYGTAWSDDRQTLHIVRHGRIVEPGPRTPVPDLATETIASPAAADDNQTMIDHFGDLVAGRVTEQRGAACVRGCSP